MNQETVSFASLCGVMTFAVVTILRSLCPKVNA